MQFVPLNEVDFLMFPDFDWLDRLDLNFALNFKHFFRGLDRNNACFLCSALFMDKRRVHLRFRLDLLELLPCDLFEVV